jgi:hypothetical protein
MTKYVVSIVVFVDGDVNIHVLRICDTLEDCHKCMADVADTLRHRHFVCPLVWVPNEDLNYSLYYTSNNACVAETLTDACGSASIREVE